jgi:hypothetical protein
MRGLRKPLVGGAWIVVELKVEGFEGILEGRGVGGGFD